MLRVSVCKLSLKVPACCLFKPLESGHLKDLKVALEAFLSKGETLQLEAKVRHNECMSYSTLRQGV